MPPTRRHDPVPRRRRVDDEGEEEGSVLGDVEDESLSEGSAMSNGDDEADGEASEISAEGQDRSPVEVSTTKPVMLQSAPTPAAPDLDRISEPPAIFQASADTEAMLSGLKQTEDGQDAEVISFDDLPPHNAPVTVGAEVAVPKAPRNETPAQRSRREHLDYIQQKNSNPAFVPNRGGFFLHDDRITSATSGLPRPSVRGRGRGKDAPTHTLRPLPVSEPTEKPWAHDLHEPHEDVQKSLQKKQNTAEHNSREPRVATQKIPTGPNRSFSFTNVLGNVSVQVSLPGMSQKVSVKSVMKQHTLLPQHRPPLRRDKPVRISIPEESPRYIFPSTERSFIFIPRALRPNQQTYTRGRGRGSFHASRRPSIFGGSVYTPSVAMSRKSSMGASVVKSGVKSPGESIYASSVVAADTRPIVRMPSQASIVPPSHPAFATNGQPILGRPVGAFDLANGAMSHGVRSNAMPMHQPRPQKTVSVAGIEIPANLSIKAPQQQLEQPFHQQMPVHVASALVEDGPPHSGQQTGSSHPVGTPLSHIPEGAVYANPFQPYPAMGAPAFYGPPYGPGPLFYPPSMPAGMPFGIPMASGVMAPSFIPGSQTHGLPYGVGPPGSVEIGPPMTSMAHESNGMVFYYDPSQYSGETQGNLAASTPYYYPPMPPGMFFPSQTG